MAHNPPASPAIDPRYRGLRLWGSRFRRSPQILASRARRGLIAVLRRLSRAAVGLWAADGALRTVAVAGERRGRVQFVRIVPPEMLPPYSYCALWEDLVAQLRWQEVEAVELDLSAVEGARPLLAWLLARLVRICSIDIILLAFEDFRIRSLLDDAARPPAIARGELYPSTLLECLARSPELVPAIHRLHRRTTGDSVWPPFDRLQSDEPRVPRRRDRRSIVFLHHAYYNFYYLAAALRRRGWDAMNVTLYAPDDPRQIYFHGTDLSLWDADYPTMRQKTHAFLDEVRSRFNMVHFYGIGVGSFFPENWDKNSKFLSPHWDFGELKRHGVKIGYTECGCLDLSSKTSFYRWSGGACDTCVHRDQPEICSDERNLAWGRKIQMMCDLVCIEGDPVIDMRSGPKVFREPLTLALDSQFWRPGLEIPERLRLPREDGELIVYHAVGNFSERTDKERKNVKGTSAVVAATNRLRAEGHRLRLEFVSDIPNKDVRFIQAQADIIVDQLRYGRYGATAREGLMLGVPVVGAVNKAERVPSATSKCIAEAPIVHATEETIYDVLKDLASSPEKRRAIGSASRAHALKWWSADACAERFEEVYDRLMAGRPVWPDAPDFRQESGLAAGF